MRLCCRALLYSIKHCRSSQHCRFLTSPRQKASSCCAARSSTSPSWRRRGWRGSGGGWWGPNPRPRRSRSRFPATNVLQWTKKHKKSITVDPLPVWKEPVFPGFLGSLKKFRRKAFTLLRRWECPLCRLGNFSPSPSLYSSLRVMLLVLWASTYKFETIWKRL